MQNDTYSVLVVTKDNGMTEIVNTMLVAPLFDTIMVSDINEARRRCAERSYNIVLVDSKDGGESDFCLDISESISTVVLLVSPSLFEQVSYRVESSGVLTFVRAFDNFSFYSIMKVAIAVQYKIRSLSFQTIKLKEKMEEIRIVNKAKLILMQDKGMSESDAHHFIEKEAMNRCAKKIAIAKEIVACNS